MLVPSIVLLGILVIAALIYAIGRPRESGDQVRPRRPFWRWFWGGMAVLSLGLAAVFAFAFYDRYWLWRDCFNELGRCYDSDTQAVYVEQAGMMAG